MSGSTCCRMRPANSQNSACSTRWTLWGSRLRSSLTTPNTASAAYDAQRRPQTAGVVLANRQGGPERCLEIVEQRAPDGFVDLDAVISRAELEEIARSYKRTAGFDPEVLNTRPSLGVGLHRATAARPAALHAHIVSS